MLRRLLLPAILLLVTAAVVPVTTAPVPNRLLRTPTVSASQIAFAYANNIWVVDKAGGTARRVTSFAGGASNPKFSPDGQTIAFTASYGGNSDVYIVAAEGGEPRRLTWHPGADEVIGWWPDGKSIIFRSGRNDPMGDWHLFTVPVAGGDATER